jgi:phospholipid/cholesterol/gamma-HCH transport system substrate-binding protein
MNERTMRIRIGLFVLAATVLLGALIVLFGSLPATFRRANLYTIRFTDAPGVAPGTPVRRSGVRIGEVRDLVLDDDRGIVRVQIAVEPRYTIRHNDQATLVINLLGTDASIDFIPQEPEEGRPVDRAPLEPGAEVVGVRQASVNTLLNRASEVVPTTQETLNDMRKSIQRLEKMAPIAEETLKEYTVLARSARETIPDLRRTNDQYRELAREARQALPALRNTNDDIGAAARNWSRLGERLDVWVQTNQERVTKTIDNLNKSAENLNEVLTRASNVLNETNQRNLADILKNTRAASERFESFMRTTDRLLQQTETTLKNIDKAVLQADSLLADIDRMMKPFGARSETISRNLDESLDKLNRSMSDVNALMRAIDQKDGTIQRLLTDPSLYIHVDEIACMVGRMMPRVDRILKDFEVFADKLARRPESLGLGGVVRPSAGIKEPPLPHYPPQPPGQ